MFFDKCHLVQRLGRIVSYCGLPLALACSHQIELSGAVQKGPFVLGSSVSVSLTDERGNPTGLVFNTQTINDSGDFQLLLEGGSIGALQGEGFYFNEVLGRLSTAPITLRAYASLENNGTQSIFLNMVTHLSFDRVRTLLEQEVPIEDAIAQAESELRIALKIGPPGFNPQAQGNAMNLLGGDTPANAYLFAVSAVMVQAGVDGVGGAVDANLQQILNTISQDLSEDGQLTPGTTQQIFDAQANLDTALVKLNLEARVQELGLSTSVPDIAQILDPDQDGVVNANDNCTLVPNLDQADSDGDGTGDACEFCGDTVVDFNEECDDGNTETTDDCVNCQNARCGDAFVQAGVENCDDGNLQGGDGCRSDCSGAEECGDGILDAGEECDDGNVVDGDGCEASCIVTPVCGNGLITGNEACEDGNLQSGDGCRGDCLGIEECGDGLVDSITGEECDDGNNINADDCEADCSLPACGNGILDQGELCLSSPQFFVVGDQPISQPTSVAIGDFNADGNQDLAVANSNNRVSVLLGAGNGSFGAPTDFPVGAGFTSVVVGDFNDDGVQDLATTSQASSQISILLGNGAGSFSTTTFDAGTQPNAVAVGDFNNDSHQDLAYTKTGINSDAPSDVGILLGTGTGTFGTLTNFAVGFTSGAFGVTVGDFDGNGNQDLAVAVRSDNVVSVRMGNGAGGFGSQVTFAVGTGPNAVVIGDFNEDGDQDLATINIGVTTKNIEGGVSILLGNGNGTFGAHTDFAEGGSGSFAIAPGDFNGDGNQDLAVANTRFNNVGVLLGNGDGSFGEQLIFAVGIEPFSIAAGDFDNNGKLDLVSANFGLNDVSVLLSVPF